MDSLPSQKKEWVLTQEAFDKLLARLDSDRETAGKKYEQIRERLIYYFERRGCMTSEEQADETINRVSRKIAEGEEIRNIPSYCYGVAQYVLKEYWKIPPVPEMPQTSPDLGELEKIECMQKCLQNLPSEERELSKQYYAAESKEKLAEQLGININALRVKVHRIRKTLNECLCDCLKKL